MMVFDNTKFGEQRSQSQETGNGIAKTKLDVGPNYENVVVPEYIRAARNIADISTASNSGDTGTVLESALPFRICPGILTVSP